MNEKNCLKCDALQVELAQSHKDGQRLLRKLQEVHLDKDQLQAFVNEANRRQRDASLLYEANFKEMLAHLEELVRHDETRIVEDGTEVRRNVGIEALELMSNTLINVYKSLKIKEFESKYETSLTSLVESLTLKIGSAPMLPHDANNNNVPTISRLSLALSQDLNEFRLKTQLCKEKLTQQKMIIQSLLSKIKNNTSVLLTAHPHLKPSEDNSVSSDTNTSTSSCTTTSSSASFQQHRNANVEYRHLPDTYMCPKCQIQIDSSKVTLKKLESHVKRCDSSKLVCIFCLKLFEQCEQVLFENHVQKHLIKQSLQRSTIKTTSSTNMAEMHLPPPPTIAQLEQHQVDVQLTGNMQLPNNSI